MDEEDLGEFGFAPKQLLAKDDFKLPSYVAMVTTKRIMIS